MNEQQARRISKLMKINLKTENPPDVVLRLVNDSVLFDSKLTGLSDKEAIDMIIGGGGGKKEVQEALSIGVMYHILTSHENPELFQRMMKYISGGGVEYWHTVLCNINMVLFELWYLTHWQCKQQLLFLIREAVKMNVKQVENVIMNTFRTVSGSGDWQSKVRTVGFIMTMLRDQENWLRSQKICTGMTTTAIIVMSNIIISTPMPITKEDQYRENLINSFVWLIRIRKHEVAFLGRDLVLVLARLGRIPQVEDLWKEIASQPQNYNCNGMEDLLGRPYILSHSRISIELQRKIDWMMANGTKNMHTYFEWMCNKHFRQLDGFSLRAECVRYLTGLVIDPAKVPETAFASRVHIIHLLIATATPGPEQQWLKTCLFMEWLGCDEKQVSFANSNAELALNVIRHSLTIQAPPPAANSLIQASHCSPFANSLFEYICKSVDLFIPSMSDVLRRNVNTAMKYCRERFQHQLPQILEHYKIDRKVGEMMRQLWPDFMRPLPGSAAATIPPLVRKKKPVVEEKKVIEPPAPVPVAPSSSEEVVVQKPTKSEKTTLKKEKEESDESALTASINKLSGELKTKIESMQSQWKDMSDAADKCEAVEGLFNFIFKNEIVEGELETASQCLLSIMGSLVSEEQSVLPDATTDKDTSEAFTHPIYSVLKLLCYPPSEDDDDDSGAEIMTTVVSTMREKDATVTYLLLYFIKGTVSNTADAIEAYKDVARQCGKKVEEMLVEDMQLCAINDIRMFSYLLTFVFSTFNTEVFECPDMLHVLCSNVDAVQLRTFISDVIREEVKVFRKDTFTNQVMASVEWPTAPQWVFWQLVYADGVPIEYFLPIIPKLESAKHDEAISNILLMLKHMDREPWPGLIRAIFTRFPTKDDNFTIDALKVLIDDEDQSKKVAELVGALIKKLISNNEIVGIGGKVAKKGQPPKVTLQQVLEHLTMFSDICMQKKQATTELFLSKSFMQDAFAAIKQSDKSIVLVKKYHTLFGVMDVCASEKESSRTLRNRQGSNSSSSSDKQSQKRKANDNDDHNGKKRKVSGNTARVEDDSDSD